MSACDKRSINISTDSLHSLLTEVHLSNHQSSFPCPMRAQGAGCHLFLNLLLFIPIIPVSSLEFTRIKYGSKALRIASDNLRLGSPCSLCLAWKKGAFWVSSHRSLQDGAKITRISRETTIWSSSLYCMWCPVTLSSGPPGISHSMYDPHRIDFLSLRMMTVSYFTKAGPFATISPQSTLTKEPPYFQLISKAMRCSTKQHLSKSTISLIMS